MEYLPFEQQSLDLDLREPTLHNELRHKRRHTHPPPTPNAKRACTQCVLCRVSLYSNEEIIHHLSTREHIGAINQFPEVRLQDVLIPESYIEEVLAGKHQMVGVASQIHEEEVGHTPNLGVMPAGASRQEYYTIHEQEERSPMEDTSPLGQTSFQLSGALRELAQKLDTSPNNISPPFNRCVNFPRRDSEMYPEQLTPTLPRPSQQPTPNFPRRDVETFREYPKQLTPTLPRPSQQPTPNFPRRDVETFREYPKQLTPTLPRPSQQPTSNFPRRDVETFREYPEQLTPTLPRPSQKPTPNFPRRDVETFREYPEQMTPTLPQPSQKPTPNFPRRDVETFRDYPEQLTPTLPQPSQKPTPNFPWRDVETFRDYPEQMTPTLPQPSQKPTPNFPRRDVKTFRDYPEQHLPRPSQKPTPNFPRRDVEMFHEYPEQHLPRPLQKSAQHIPRLNTYTQSSHADSPSYHQSNQTLDNPPLLGRRLGHPFPYTTQIQLPSRELGSHQPPLTPTLPQPSQSKPQGPPQVAISQPPIHSPDPAESGDVKEHMIHCKICGIIVPNQFHWEAHIKRSSHLMNLQQSEEREAQERDEVEAESEVMRVEESKQARLEEEMTTELMQMEEEDTSFYKEELEKESEDIPAETSTFMPPKQPARTMTLAQLRLRCGYCDIIIHERGFWPAHIKSKRHLMASAAPDKESPTVRPIPSFYCDICDVSPLDEPQFAAHINGKKHQKKVHFKEMSEAGEFTDAQRSPVKQKGALSAKFSPPQLKGKVVRMKPKPAKLSPRVQKPAGVTLLKKTPQGTAMKKTTLSARSRIPETSQRILPQSPTTSLSPGGQVVTRAKGQHSVVMPTERCTDQTLGKGKIIKLKRSWRRDGNSETSSLVSNESATLPDQKSPFTFDVEAPSQRILRTSKTTKPSSTRRSPILPPSPTEDDHPPQAIRCISQRQVKSSPRVTNPQTIKPPKFHDDSKALRKQPSVSSQLGARERSRPAASPVPPSGVRGNSIPRPNLKPPDRIIQEHSFSDTREVPMRLDYQQPIKSEYSSREESDYRAHIEQMRSEAELELWGTGTKPEMDQQLYGGEKDANIRRSKSPMGNTEGEEEIFPEFEIYPDTPDFEQYHGHDHELSVDKFKAVRKKQQEEGINYEGRYDFTSDSPELQLVVKTQNRSSSLERRNEWEYPNSPNVSSRRDCLPVTRIAGVHPNYTPPIFRNAVSGNRVVPPIFRNAALQHGLNQSTAPSGNIPVHAPSLPIFRNVTLQHGLNSSNRSSNPSGNHVVPPPIFRNVTLQHGLTRSANPSGNIPGHVDPSSSPPIFRNVALQHGLNRSGSPSGNIPGHVDPTSSPPIFRNVTLQHGLNRSGSANPSGNIPGHVDPSSSPPIFRNVALQHGLNRSGSPSGNIPGHVDPTSSPPIFRNVALQHGLNRSGSANPSGNIPGHVDPSSSPPIFRNIALQHGLNRSGSASPSGNIPGHVDPSSSPPIFRNVALQHGLNRSGSPSGNIPVFRNPLLQRSSDSNSTSNHSSSQTQSPSGNSPVPVTIATSDRIIADTSGRPRAIQTIDYYHGQNPFIGRNPFLERKQKEFLGIWPNKWNNGSL